MIEKIINYYENYDEEGRLFRDKAHMIEYLTTIRYFDRLFAPKSRILDACAGTGSYSLYLASKGHKVTACDLVERNINIIRSKPDADKLDCTTVCNVLDLSRFDENSFDVVLCMGALYHLMTDDERKKAMAECVRICKSGGMVVFAYINKIGAIIATIKPGLENIGELLKILDDTDDGIFRCTMPQVIVRLSSECGLEMIHNIGVDSISFTHMDKINAASNENFAQLMEYHYATCEEESIIGSSIHGLYIGRKK